MASLYIKDPSTADRVTSVARRLGTTKTDAVRQALDAWEEKYGVRSASLKERLDAYRRDHPLPPPTGLKADKAFFDAMWDDA